MMTLEEIKQGVRTLTIEQRKQLIAFVVDSLTEHEEIESVPKKRSILEFEGLGAEIWQGIDLLRNISMNYAMSGTINHEDQHCAEQHAIDRN